MSQYKLIKNEHENDFVKAHFIILQHLTVSLYMYACWHTCMCKRNKVKESFTSTETRIINSEFIVCDVFRHTKLL